MSILNDPNSMVSCLSSGIEDGGGTLPRHRGSNINMVTGQKHRPIAKVIGNVSTSLPKPQQLVQYQNPSEYLEKNSCSSKVIKANVFFLIIDPYFKIYSFFHFSQCYGMHCRSLLNSPKTILQDKKQAPDPPRRHFTTAITADGAAESTIDEICEHYDALKLAIHHQQMPTHSYDTQMCCQYIHQKAMRQPPQYINPNNCHIAQHQPIYANYNPVPSNSQSMIQHVQTKAEIHAEKPQTINGHEVNYH